MDKTAQSQKIHIIGGGLAGSEAAWQAACMGVDVVLHEMRPVQKTDAHKTEGLAELVCSNSFRSDDKFYNAVGLIHEEMRQCGSLIMAEGDKAAVPAGGALAVDRDLFSQNVTAKLESHPNIEIRREAIDGIPPEEWDSVIIATGPLTFEPLAKAIQELTGEDELSFFDAIAPIVHTDSINFDIAWFQSRYDKVGPAGTGKDYINCPMNKEQYETFVQALLDAPKTEFKEWEATSHYFDGCMPIEVMAERGVDTLRFGPMKPVGLTDPHTGKQPYAVVQLRQDNTLGTLYNIVGFQTKMRYGAQTDVFKTIPGLEDASFARLGGLHRNTFINSPKLLNERLQLNAMPRLRFAGQITGCEGYVESAAVGLMAGRMAASEILGISMERPASTTALGALLNHITSGANAETFQPMNVNYGLFPPLTTEEQQDALEAVSAELGKKVRKLKSREKKKAMSERALRDIVSWAPLPTLAEAAE